MPYYHVYVRYYVPSEDTFEETYELDLSLEELKEQIVTPYLKGESFMCGGHQVNPFATKPIIISKSIESSNKLIPRIRAEEARKSEITGIGWGLSDEFLVVDHSQNVTRELITHPPKKKESIEKPEKTKEALNKNVFIVHGRDKQPALELARILERRFGLNAIFLWEQAHHGRTIIEQLEEHSDVQYAFVIVTPDDVGALEGNRLRYRARQNVILEFGLFVGKIGRKKITILLKGDIEIPSDMQGILYSRFYESPEECFLQIERNLKAAGYEI